MLSSAAGSVSTGDVVSSVAGVLSSSAGDARVRHASMTSEGKAALRAAAVTHLAGIQRHFARFLPDEDAAVISDRFATMCESVAGD